MILVIEEFGIASRNTKCSICGTGNHQNERQTRVISTGVDIDFEGRFDICWSCAVEIGQAVNMVPEDDLASALGDLAKLNDYCWEVEQKLASKDAVIDNLAAEIDRRAAASR